MDVNAQHLITVSIGKIAGCRTQRGGVCLRKNLLVASVLTSARAYYYEEMCHKMHEHSTEIVEDYDSSNSPKSPSDWDKEDVENSCEQSTDIVTLTDATPCDQSPPQQEQLGLVDAVCQQCNVNDMDKENQVPEQVIEFTELKPVEISSCKSTTEPENLSHRTVLSDSTSVKQNKGKTCKRKMSELEEACDNITPKKAKIDVDIVVSVSAPSITISSNVNSVEQVSIKSESQSITSLVSIFRSGLQGLSGDVKSQSNTNNRYSVPRNSFVQGPISIAAC